MAQTGYEQIQPGWDVYGNDGEKIASVVDANDSYITISKGLFLPKDYYIPASGIQTVDADRQAVTLSCAKSDLDRMGWDKPAAAESGRGEAWAGGSTTDYEAQTGVRETQPNQAWQGTQGESQRVQRYEEELRADKSSRQAGEVRLNKDVTQEEQAFDVPVTREDVEVRRVPVNRPAGETEQAFDDGQTVRIPVRSEEVHVSKEPRVVEEIEVRKTPRQETQRVSDTVRKERVNVEREGDVDVRGERELAGAGADRFQGQSNWQDDAGANAAAGSDLETDEPADHADEGELGELGHEPPSY